MLAAFFPGTFDPITLGHVDLVQRASQLFDEVVVAVGVNDEKSALFTLNERISMIENVIDNMSNVRVIQFDGLAVVAAKEQGCGVILRGVRDAGDVSFEKQLAHMNRELASDIDTLWMSPSPCFSAISSTIVRQIIRMGGDASQFVPKYVAEKLK